MKIAPGLHAPQPRKGKRRGQPPLWTMKAPTAGVEKYLLFLSAEFGIPPMKSGVPYHGPASLRFRRVTANSDTGSWGLRSREVANPLVLDLLAAAEALGGSHESRGCSGGPGGIGVDSAKLHIPLLDGGVSVDVVMTEHERTNRMEASQRTIIRGPTAYRALLQVLGFDWIPRRLLGETRTPRREEFRALVHGMLLEKFRGD